MNTLLAPLAPLQEGFLMSETVVVDAIPELDATENQKENSNAKAESIDKAWQRDDLTPLVDANANVLVNCSWLPGAPVTVMEAMFSYPDWAIITEETQDIAIAAVNELLANKAKEIPEEPSDQDNAEESAEQDLLEEAISDAEFDAKPEQTRASEEVVEPQPRETNQDIQSAQPETTVSAHDVLPSSDIGELNAAPPLATGKAKINKSFFKETKPKNALPKASLLATPPSTKQRKEVEVPPKVLPKAAHTPETPPIPELRKSKIENLEAADLAAKPVMPAELITSSDEEPGPESAQETQKQFFALPLVPQLEMTNEVFQIVENSEIPTQLENSSQVHDLAEDSSEQHHHEEEVTGEINIATDEIEPELLYQTAPALESGEYWVDELVEAPPTIEPAEFETQQIDIPLAETLDDHQETEEAEEIPGKIMFEALKEKISDSEEWVAEQVSELMERAVEISLRLEPAVEENSESQKIEDITELVEKIYELLEWEIDQEHLEEVILYISKYHPPTAEHIGYQETQTAPQDGTHEAISKILVGSSNQNLSVPETIGKSALRLYAISSPAYVAL